jgi:CRP-like cAMP-binding protein
MDIQLLNNHISLHIQLTEEEQSFLQSVLHAKKIKKKHFLLQEGEVNNYVTFVTAGILRIYSIDKNGFEHILQFAPPGWWIGDMKSMLTLQPATLNIDALEDSEVLWISKDDLNKLYTTVPKFERFFRILAENSIAAHQQRLVNNLSLSAAERYNNFCRLYPSLIQSLPQKQVASYIGVTPEFLSKMLNNLTEKK